MIGLVIAVVVGLLLAAIVYTVLVGIVGSLIAGLVALLVFLIALTRLPGYVGARGGPPPV